MIRFATLLDDVVGHDHILGAVPTDIPWQYIVFPYLNAGTLSDHVHQDVILKLIVHAHKVLLAVLHADAADLVTVWLDEDIHLFSFLYFPPIRIWLKCSLVLTITAHHKNPSALNSKCSMYTITML